MVCSAKKHTRKQNVYERVGVPKWYERTIAIYPQFTPNYAASVAVSELGVYRNLLGLLL